MSIGVKIFRVLATPLQKLPLGFHQAAGRFAAWLMEHVAGYRRDLVMVNLSRSFPQKKWKEIGAVPRKQSDAIWKRFRAACDEFFESKEKSFKASRPVRQAKNAAGRVLSEKDKLVARYKTLEQEIATQENNIMFFAKGSGNALLDQMRQKIEDAKQELKTLEDKIRSIEE